MRIIIIQLMNIMSPSSMTTLSSLNKRQHSQRAYWLFACIALLLLCTILSMMLGAKSIAPITVWHTLTGEISNADSVIIWQGRLPRTLLGLVCGAALGLSGAIIQAITRNPLADPGILGINAGASFAVVIAIALLNVSAPEQYIAFALVGALCTTSLVYLLGTLGNPSRNPIRYVLGGVAVSAVLMGISSGITLLNPTAFDKLRFWSAGSLDVRNLDLILTITPLIGMGIVIALLLASPLNALSLGDSMATSLGLSGPRIMLLALLAITLLCGASTAIAGPIGFIGLMIPHVARWIAGQDQRWIMAFTLILSPILLLSADILGRFLLANELRVSIVTALIGAPVMIWLVRQQQRV
jgi:ferric enterobactin transport system permease protein